MSRVLVVTSCTSAKTCGESEGPVAAQHLYAGGQHAGLMRGGEVYRAAGEPAGRLDLRIVSAGLGLLHADEMVRGYGRTFAGMPRARLSSSPCSSASRRRYGRRWPPR